MTHLSGQWAWWGGGLLLFPALLLARRLIGRLVRLVLRSSGWLALLALWSQAGVPAGLHLGVNLLNALVLGLLGAPGFGLLLMLQWALR
jgi:inhibitor of the pro-sigma K processing machinery